MFTYLLCQHVMFLKPPVQNTLNLSFHGNSIQTTTKNNKKRVVQSTDLRYCISGCHVTA